MIKVKDGYAKLINTTYTGSADRVLLSNGGDKAISDFATASSLNNYVTLNTNQTISGVKTFSSSLKLNKGVGITDNLDNGILGVNCTNWTGIPSDGSSVSLGTLYNSLYFRSSKDNMYHYRFDTNTAYKILDESNYLSIVRPSGYISSGTANLSSYWCKMWDITHTSLYNDLDLTLYVHSTYNNTRGIIHIRIRPNPTYDDEGKTVSGVFTLQISIVQITGNLNPDRFRLYHNSSGHCELWGDVDGLWGVYNYCLLSCTYRVDKEIRNYGNFYSTSFSTAQTLPTDKYYNLTNVLYKQTSVTQHTTNNVEYPLVWSNLGNTNSVYSDLLYKSYAHLLYNPALKRITTGQYVANNGEGPHFTAQSASGKWAYIRLHNSSNYYDIGTRNDKGGLWLARPNGSDKGIYVNTEGQVGINTSDVSSALVVNGIGNFVDSYIPLFIRRSSTFPAIGYYGGDDANTIHGYIGFSGANNPAWCKTDGSTVLYFLHTGNYMHVLDSRYLPSNYYWADIPISTSASSETNPTFRVSKSQYMYFTARDGSNAGYVGRGSTQTDFIHLEAYTGNGIKFGTNNVTHSIIDTSGRFGINTTSPEYTLHVNGVIATTDRVHTNLITLNPNDAWSDDTNNHPWYGYDHRYVNTGVFSTTISDYFGMTLKTAKASLSLTNTGLIGINTYSPTATLHVNGESKFNDTIHIYNDSTGNYTGGIRLYGTAKNDTLSCIMFGCDPAATSGLHENQWLIGRDNLNRFVFRKAATDLVLFTPTSLFFNLGDPTLTIYSGKVTDAKSDGNVCLQTCIDGANGQSSTYPPNYSARHNLVLLPRGGLVYIGYNPDPGTQKYKLWVHGNVYSEGYIEPNTASSLKGIKFGDNSYLNSLNGLLIWQSSEAIRFGSSSWNWNDWAGLKYNHSLKTIYLGIADDVIFNSNNNTLSGGNIKFPGIQYITLDKTSIVVTTNTSSNYRTLSEFYKGSSENSTYAHDAQIGWHNTGDTDGALVLLPYATDSDPWNASVGLYISKTRLLYNYNTVLTSNNYPSILDQRYYTETESDAKYARLASPNNLIHNTNEFTFASPAFSGEIHFNWRTSSGEKDGDITAYYFDNGKGGILASITSGCFSGSAASLRDYNNNSQVITASYKSGGFSTNPSWLCAWNSYHITYVSPSVLEVKSANYLNSVGLANPQTGRTLNYGNVYSYNTNASYNTGAPTTYTSVIGFGRGTHGTVEICGEWTLGRGLWARALRDYQDNWYEWDRILTESTYALVLDSKYLAIGAYTFKTLSAVNPSGWINNATDDKIIPTMSFIAYWNGAYSGTASNLIYCKKGAFGDAAVKSVTTSVTSNSTALVTSGGVYTALAGYLSLAGGTMTGSIITPADDSKGIIPAANNYGQIGSSDKKFYRMYAATFYGDLSGNATSATSATQLSGSGVTSDPTPNSNGTLSVCYGGGSGYTGTTSMAFAAILNFGSYSRGFLLWAARVGAGTNNSLKFRIGNSAATAWDTEKTILDNTNYSTYITSVNYANSAGKLGTSTLGSSSQPIYLNGGTPTACSFKIWKGTLSQYNAISSKDSNTLYFITD